MGQLKFIYTVRAPEHFLSGRSQYQSYISSNFTISSACALQAFICRTHSIWFSAFSCSVTPFCSASDRTISFMRFRAASSISAQYCLTYTQLWAEGLRLLKNPPGFSQHIKSISNQSAKLPFTKMGTFRPSWVVPTMERSAVPTMKSTWVTESLRPWAFSCSLSMSRPPSMQG